MKKNTEKVWSLTCMDSQACLILNEKKLEGESCTFSVCSSWSGEKCLVLPLPELEAGMIFSISATSTLKWEFIPVDYAFVLTVKDARFSGEVRKVSPPEKRERFQHPVFTPRAGRMISELYCIYRL